MSEFQRQAAAHLCIGFDGLELTAGARGLLEVGVRHVILFTRNAESRSQVGSLCREIQAAASEPVLICVDQEGGDVQRLGTGFTTLPEARVIGDVGSERARDVGATMAAELRSVGIGWNLAPVLDVDTNPDNPVIGARSFGQDPATVAACGVAMIEAMQSNRVAACGKHFPGHGDTEVDSHLDLPIFEHGFDRLDTLELIPFRAAIDVGVASIMTAHVLFSAIDSANPATLSPRIVDGLLRDELGYGGVIVSDCLEMKAITDRYDVGDAAVAALAAGVDLVLCCHTEARQHRIIEAVAEAIHSGSVDPERAESSKRRLDGMSGRFRV